MLREGAEKLVCYVGMPPQSFDLAADPDEAHDLVQEGRGPERAKAREAKLRATCDAEEVGAQAKASQRAWAECWGGREAVAAEAFWSTRRPRHAAERRGSWHKAQGV